MDQLGATMEEKHFTTTVELIKDYEFRVNFGEGIAALLVDEPQPLGGGHGPNASRLVSAAVGNCLSASLLFCLRRGRVEPRHIKSTVTTTMTRNEKGRWRVHGAEVSLVMDLDPQHRDRIGRCLELFEDYCVVTQSVRQGIGVAVTVTDQNGTVYHSSGGHAG
jgi:organic hydroperoxide reductase OsmC/OhrA